MSWGFEVGRDYNRRRDIHERFGGQQQGGIITPKEHPLVIIITGEEGLQHGYADRHREDGAFEYFGEGQLGDMQLQKGNRAIAGHAGAGKSLLLLFRKTSGGLRFEGEMVYEDHHIERSPDRSGKERDALVFELRHLEGVVETVEMESAKTELPLDELRKRALAAADDPHVPAVQGKRNVYQRSRDVRISENLTRCAAFSRDSSGGAAPSIGTPPTPG
jgi:5-methylcytosine-specific restriction enzyme A